MSRKNPNLLHGLTRVVIEDVTKRHKTVCGTCDEKPLVRRLLVERGSGMSQVREIRCISCGTRWLYGRVEEYDRAANRLRLGEGIVRE